MAGINVRAPTNPDAKTIRDAILALPDGDRQLVISRPTSGQKEVIAIQLNDDGRIVCECIDTPVP